MKKRQKVIKEMRKVWLSFIILLTVAAETLPADHPLVLLAREFPDRILLCPHQAGITQTAFRNVYRMLFENLGELMAGRRPQRIVNGL